MLGGVFMVIGMMKAGTVAEKPTVRMSAGLVGKSKPLHLILSNLLRLGTAKSDCETIRPTKLVRRVS